MAATLVEEFRIPIGQSKALVAGTVLMDNSYPAGGEAIDAAGDGYDKLFIAPTGGYLPEFVKSSQKVLVRTLGIAAAGGTCTDATLAFSNVGLTPGAGAALLTALNEAPGAGAGDVFLASVAAATDDVTVSIWQDDANAATEDSDVSYLATQGVLAGVFPEVPATTDLSAVRFSFFGIAVAA